MKKLFCLALCISMMFTMLTGIAVHAKEVEVPDFPSVETIRENYLAEQGEKAEPLNEDVAAYSAEFSEKFEAMGTAETADEEEFSDAMAVSYYSGTSIPTYTYVTGRTLYTTDTDDEYTYYFYYYNVDDHVDYINYLITYYGWSLYGSTTADDGSYVMHVLTKGSQTMAMIADFSINRTVVMIERSTSSGGTTTYPSTVNVSTTSGLASPHNYYNNMDTTWIYTHPSDADALQVTFSASTKVESGYDYIYIYDGDGTLIDSYTGTELAGETIEVEGDVIKVRLTSDVSNVYYGFSVTNIEAIVEEDVIYTSVASSLASSHNYANNSDITWVYTHPTDADLLSITFSTSTSFESGYDYLYVYDSDGTYLARYTGTQLAGQTLTIEGDGFMLNLDTDSTNTAYGFAVVGVCGYLDVSTKAALASPHSYPNSMDTTWVYTHPTEADSLQVTFSSSTKVESGYDYIYIYDGEGDLVGRYTGTDLANRTITVTGDSIWIRLTSDVSNTYYGFSVTNIVAQVTQTLPDTINVSTMSGLASPHNYYNNMDTTWVYTHPADADRLRVTFSNSTQVESSCDKIYIYNGNNSLIGTYTGTQLAGQTITVSGDVIKVRLTSDSSITYYGFSVTNIVAEVDQTLPSTINVSTMSDLASPHNYYNNMDTTWVYTHSADADRLKVTFSNSTQVESSYDKIYIYDGNNSLVGTYTGAQLAGQTITVNGNVIKVRLTSDGSNVAYGFSVTSIVAEVDPDDDDVVVGDEPRVYITNATGDAGDTVTVNLVLENNTGFANLGVEIDYNSDVLTLTNVVGNNGVGATFTKSQTYDTQPYVLTWDSTENVNFNGTLATLTFRIAADAEDGDYEISVDFQKGVNGTYTDGYDVNYDEDFEELGLVYSDGCITVGGHVPGDINGDGVVNNRDGTYLLRYLSGWTIEGLNEAALDVDGNGSVNNRDGTTLLRYLSGWTVELH